MVKAGGAQLLLEQELTPERLLTCLLELFRDRAKLQQMAKMPGNWHVRMRAADCRESSPVSPRPIQPQQIKGPLREWAFPEFAVDRLPVSTAAMAATTAVESASATPWYPPRHRHRRPWYPPPYPPPP